jgi:hypothetical protein
MAKKERERPVAQPDSWAKITVVLLDRHVAYLDRFAVEIRLRFGYAVSRAELIRALIEASAQTPVVLSDASTSREMVEMLRDAWSGKRRKR